MSSLYIVYTYHIYSNRSRTPISSRTHVQTLSGRGHDCQPQTQSLASGKNLAENVPGWVSLLNSLSYISKTSPEK